MINSKLYDVLKPIALVWLPALGALYFALSGIWGVPDAEQVIGSITAVDTFLGAVLHISSVQYTPPSGGKLIVDPEARKISLEPDVDPEQILTLKDGQKVTYTVVEDKG